MENSFADDHSHRGSLADSIIDPDEHDESARHRCHLHPRRSQHHYGEPSSPPYRREGGSSFDSSFDDKQLYYAHHNQRKNSLSPLRHLTILIIATLLLTIATHRHTFSSLRYKLHSLGTYRMRGVPNFQNDSRRETSSSQSSWSSSSRSSASTSPQEPLMMPREYANRRGAKFTIPRGTPLPPPILALVNVKACGAALTEDTCPTDTSTAPNVNGSGSSEALREEILNSLPANGYNMGSIVGAASLECKWCPAVGCVPKEMIGAMCGGLAASK